jgi:hypothetical protein
MTSPFKCTCAISLGLGQAKRTSRTATSPLSTVCTIFALRCRIQGMLMRSCLLRRLQPICYKQTLSASTAQRAFHQTPRTMASPTMPNHYETLGVPTDASPTDVKKYEHTLLSLHSQSTNTPSQAILQALQSQPPRPPSQRYLQIKALRSHQRSLLHPRLSRQAQNLRPRLPPRRPLLLWQSQQLQRPPRLLLLPQLACRRPPGLRLKQETHTIQRSAAVFLSTRRLWRAQREAFAARDQRTRRDVRSSFFGRGHGAWWFHARRGQRCAAFRPVWTSGAA